MEWYYVESGQRVGPLSSEQFEQAAASGKIAPHTLVWKEGMAEWQAYSAVAPAATGVPPIAGTVANCAECGQVFPTAEMISYQNSYVCAGCKRIFFQRIQEGAPMSGAASLWRNDKALVMAKGAPLPQRCAKCNQAATLAPIKRTLYWHASWVYVFILINIIVYAIIAMAVRKKAPIGVYLCAEHRKNRWLYIGVSWLMILMAVGLFIGALNVNNGAIAGLSAFCLLVTGAVLGVWKGTLVRAKKIDDRFAWVNGFGPAFLSTLPEWHGPG